MTFLNSQKIALSRVRLRDVLLRECSISEGAIIFMVAFLISAVLGIIRQMLLNARFGLEMEADAYYAAARLPETIVLLTLGGTLANAMIPVLLRVARSQSEAAAQRLTSLIVTTMLAVMAPLVLLAITATPFFVTYILTPGFDTATSSLTISLTRIMLIELLLMVVTTAASAVLTSRNQFLLPALSIAVTNFSLISGVLASIIYPPIGIYGPTIGAVGDAILQMAILIPGLRFSGFHYQPLWSPADPHLHEVVRLLIPSGLSGTINYTGSIIDTAFASLAREVGGVAALQNAYLMIGLPIRLMGIAIGQAAFPRLADYAAAEDWQRMRRTLFWALSIAIACSVMIMIGLLLFGQPAIRLMFERGRFDANATALTYALLAAYTIGLPSYVGTEILTRSLYALRDMVTPLITNLLQTSGRLVIIWLLLEPIGVAAIPVAFAITSTLETVAMGWVMLVKLQRRLRASQL